MALAVVVTFNAGQTTIIAVAVIAFVVLVLGVWFLQSGEPKPIQGNPRR